MIDKNLANRAHAGTSMSPETRGQQEVDGYIEDVASIRASLHKFAHTEAEKSLIDEEMIGFEARYSEKWNAKMSAHANCISSMVAGPSGFPTRRAQKANTSYDNRFREMTEFRERAINAINRKVNALRVEEAGGELEVMKDKIEDAERMQTLMKACNRIVRLKKLSDEEKTTKMIDEQGISEETARSIIVPDYIGSSGFAPYQLSNNNANIRRMKQRLVDLQIKEDTPTSDISFSDGSIIDNAEDDRVQIDFDTKPDDEMRSKLKESGWRWAPSVLMWQRKRTPAALQSAKQICGVSQ